MRCPLCKWSNGGIKSLRQFNQPINSNQTIVGREIDTSSEDPDLTWDNYIFNEERLNPNQTLTEIQRYELVKATKTVHENALYSIHENVNGAAILLNYQDNKNKYVSSFDSIDVANEYCSEQGWPFEVSKVKQEIGELYHVYTDFATLLSRIGWIMEHIPDQKKHHAKKAMAMLKNDMKMLFALEMDLRNITKDKKPPARNPIQQQPRSDSLKTEFAQVSTDVAKLSARIRNVGQSMDTIRSIDMSGYMDRLEKISDKLRKAWVEFYKIFE